jgi:hypothetical protein
MTACERRDKDCESKDTTPSCSKTEEEQLETAAEMVKRYNQKENVDE